MTHPYLRLQGIEFKPFYFQPGVGYLASVLKQAGHEVKIYNPDVVKETDNIPKRSRMSSQERLKNHQRYFGALSMIII